ncbi:TPA: hypothetical protein N0F65_000069 [Lagenidium giganteum]|uniref:SCP domain-containing protein n=1 Tax=Lagenidium giganteum TaxID=4803 RepID=A0AAV2YJF4_9STRA|nr:TPA: hypothetical protein N0F65_000069 [Lagenidium giganteum]
MKVILAASALLLVQVHANAHGNGPAPTSNGMDSKPNVHNSGVCSNAYTSELRDYIVEAHNHARATLVPTGEAANMRRLEWSEELAISASDWVENCQFEHYTEDYAYGQNLMYGGNSLDKATVDGWMKAWVEDEICDADRNGAGMMQLNHASAVLWADTFLVGCASKMCPNGYLTACNYFNPGNWQGQKAYQPGYGPAPAPVTYGPAPVGPTPCPSSQMPKEHKRGKHYEETVTPCPSAKPVVPETRCPSGKPVIPETPCPSSKAPKHHRKHHNATVTPCPSSKPVVPETPCPTTVAPVTPCPSTPAPDSQPVVPLAPDSPS